MAQQVKLPKDVSGAAFSMLGQYAYGSQPQLMTDASLDRVQMATKAIGKPWSMVSGYAEVMRSLAEQSRQRDALLGADEETSNQVKEWLQFQESDGGVMTDARLQKVNEHLRTRNYLVGHAITVADFAVFAAVHPAVSAFSQEQVQQHVNLVRWFDHIQHTADTHNTHSKVAVQKPTFQPPPPPAAPAKDKVAGKGKDASDSKAAAAAAATAAAPSDGSAQKPRDQAAAPATADGGAAQQSATAAAAENSAPGGSKKEKKDKKEKKEKPPAAPKAPASITQLDIRVGKVVDVQNHPEAEKLYVEKIDLGEGEPRTIVSGLRNFVSLEEMRGRHVVVLANLKPAKLVGIASAGMVLCSSDEAHTAVDPIAPPEGAAIGERVTFEGHEGEADAQLNPKKKVFEELAPSLRTDADGFAVYQDVKFMTSAGPVTSKLPNGIVR